MSVCPQGPFDDKLDAESFILGVQFASTYSHDPENLPVIKSEPYELDGKWFVDVEAEYEEAK